MAPAEGGIVAVYPTEFQAPDAYEAVDSPLFLGLEPLLLAILVALGALLFFLGWMVRNAQTRRDPDAAGSIWKAVDDALKAAMKADGGSLVGKAEDVERVIRKRLGATLSIAHGLNPGLASLKAALAGQRHVPHAHAETHDDHDDPGHDKPADDGPATESSSSTSVTQITVINGVRERGQGGGPGGGGGGHGGHDHGGSLSPRERDHTIRAAIADLNDWWRDKDARIREMRAAYSELSAD